jgi:hypothetical protein
VLRKQKSVSITEETEGHEQTIQKGFSSIEDTWPVLKEPYLALK